jgi:tyrosyl-tRNA synthetase
MSKSDISLDDFQPRSGALSTLLARGHCHQATSLEGLDAALSAGPCTIYNGFDATADSLHVGHLVPIMALRRMQQAGHRPIILVGGGTTRIGDPSFRPDARPMLSEAEIASNIESLSRVFGRFLHFGDGPTDAILVNNAEWLDEMRWIDMLRDVGRHFSVNRMLGFDSVKSRLEEQKSLSFLEFNYMILQAFDFLELSRRHGCAVQMGGADQWGNIVSGVDLVRRMEGREVFGLTSPLLTTSSGAKMGKTAAGAVWLNEDRLAPFDFWQFWRNTEDADVARFLALFTDLPLDEIDEITSGGGSGINAAKIRLANEATALAHGPEAAAKAQASAAAVFGKGGGTAGLPILTLDEEQRQGEVRVLDLLVQSGFRPSKKAARRSIEERSVRLDGEIVEDLGACLAAQDLPCRLSLGRKNHILVE